MKELFARMADLAGYAHDSEEENAYENGVLGLDPPTTDDPKIHLAYWRGRDHERVAELVGNLLAECQAAAGTHIYCVLRPDDPDPVYLFTTADAAHRFAADHPGSVVTEEPIMRACEEK